MSSSDPSMVDTATLERSLSRDITEAGKAATVLEKSRWLKEALVTAHELLRRDEAKTRAR